MFGILVSALLHVLPTILSVSAGTASPSSTHLIPRSSSQHTFTTHLLCASQDLSSLLDTCSGTNHYADACTRFCSCDCSGHMTCQGLGTGQDYDAAGLREICAQQEGPGCGCVTNNSTSLVALTTISSETVDTMPAASIPGGGGGGPDDKTILMAEAGTTRHEPTTSNDEGDGDDDGNEWRVHAAWLGSCEWGNVEDCMSEGRWTTSVLVRRDAPPTGTAIAGPMVTCTGVPAGARKTFVADGNSGGRLVMVLGVVGLMLWWA